MEMLKIGENFKPKNNNKVPLPVNNKQYEIYWSERRKRRQRQI